MNLTVENLSPQDRAEWRSLYHGYAEFYEMAMDDEILETIWGWIHDASNSFYGLIAKDESGRALGFMHCREMPSPLRGAHVGFLDDLFVAPDARGQGVVEALYAALDDLARRQGWPFVRWITAKDNDRARAAYDRLSKRTGWVTYQLDVSLSPALP
jgi:ribosomal protein S18 acetylase RimI-like enzyme